MNRRRLRIGAGLFFYTVANKLNFIKQPKIHFSCNNVAVYYKIASSSTNLRQTLSRGSISHVNQNNNTNSSNNQDGSNRVSIVQMTTIAQDHVTRCKQLRILNTRIQSYSKLARAFQGATKSFVRLSKIILDAK